MKTTVTLTAVFVSILFLSYALPAEDFVFGSKVNSLQTFDIDKKTISIPEKGKVTVLFLFNIDNDAHHKLLSKLNLYYVDQIQDKKKFQVIAISRGNLEKFQKIRQSYSLHVQLVNDLNGKILSIFKFSCGVCNQIFICDKKGIVRFNATSVDFYFINEIIQRYEQEEE